MPQGRIRIHGVPVAPPHPLRRHIAGLLQLRHDPLRGALGDADKIRYIAHPRFRIARKAKKDMGVVGQESPSHEFYYTYCNTRFQ